MPLLAATAWLLAMLGPGCVPFWNVTLREMAEARKSALPTPDPLDAVAVEVFFIERPPGDPLMGDVLWRELDQISSVDAATRERLRTNGLRFGVAGTAWPFALQGLTEGTDAGHITSRQTYQMPSGVTHDFTCGELPDPVFVRLHDGGETQDRSYPAARGMIRCKIDRAQAGWASLEVLPEIHFGREQMRPAADNEKWDWTGRQEVESFYGQRFRVALNAGEAIVLGPVGDRDDSLGSRLFQVSPNGKPTEKLLVIRIRSMGQVNAANVR